MLLKEYINKYISDNLSNIDYEFSDILRIVANKKNMTKNNLYIKFESIILSSEEILEIEKDLNKFYKNNIPLQYILGVQPFYNEEYIVNENVLIPRADTEVLVETAIKYIKKYNLKNIIDMCTGSGCVGISISKNSNIENVILVDISKKALEVANKNIIKNDVNDKVTAICSNLFDVFFNDEKYKGFCDIIVSNPPYIPTFEIKKLDKNVQNEPLIALDGGSTGMDFYIKILEQSQKILKNGAYIIFEIGYDEFDKIKKVIESFNNFEFVEYVKDYNMNDRVVVCRFLQK